jgi:phenylacetate-CoA ligase
MNYGTLLRGAIFPLTSAVTKRKFWREYRQAVWSQRLTASALLELQNQKLQKLMHHAYAEVPYYRRLFDAAGIGPDDIKTAADLVKLPITTKATLREAGFEMTRAANHAKFATYEDSTSGSTGEPFRFLGDVRARDLSTAYTIRSWNWGGYKVGDHYVSLWGHHKQDASNKLFNRLMRNKYLSAFDLDTEFADFVKTIRKHRPKLITAYTASMVKFATMLVDAKITDLTIPIVIPTSENLYPEHRAIIEQAIHGKVYDRYGSRELGAVASECREQDGLHINAESFIVEYEPLPDKKVTCQRLIVTHLDKFGMPLIRYDTGDLATPHHGAPCACGLPHPKIQAIDGRVTDFLLLKDDSKVPYLYFNYSLEQYGAKIRQFQIAQPTRERMILSVVATNSFTAEEERALVKKLEAGMRGLCTIEVKRVKHIPLTKSGKFAIVSEKAA